MKALLTLVGVSVLVLLLEAFQLSHLAFPLAMVGVILAMGFAATGIDVADGDMLQDFFGSMVSFDRFGSWMSMLVLLTTIIWLLTAQGYFSRGSEKADRLALALFATCGGLMLCGYQNLTMLFLGVETLSVPLYVLAGSRKGDVRSNEAALKYFLLGAFASTFLLLGIALVYGATGSFDLTVIHERAASLAPGADSLLTAGVLLILAGLLFKVSAVPFHFWAPDVYQGAPNEVTAFMATVVKMSAFTGLIRLFGTTTFEASASAWAPALAVCVALTMMLGNITAAVQDSVKRLLSFSSVAHAGFLLLGVLAMRGNVVGYYAFAYGLASLLAFGIVGVVAGKRDSVASFNGLARRSPVLAFAMTVALVSLAGIPPTSGFFGKYFALLAAFERGYVALVIFGVLGSLVGIYYYFKIIIAMFLREPEPDATPLPALTMGEIPMFVVLACLVLALGIKPDWVIDLVGSAGSIAVK
jgi:NADH-quinone oxidoreductase subunit N